MRLPTSGPTRQPKPDKEWYSTRTLNLFPRINRKMFAALFAQQAPPFDPQAKWVKYWWDTEVASADPNGSYTYQYVVLGSGNPQIVSMTITNGEAAKLNIPGHYNYPVYMVKPTKAYVVGPTGTKTGSIPANRLSTHDQAEYLQQRIQSDVKDGVKMVVGEDRLDGSYFHYVYITGQFSEPRRLWHIAYPEGGNTGYVNVGDTLIQMYANGVGSPGKFIKTASGVIAWQQEVVTQDKSITLPECPIPVRDLDSDETLVRRSPFDLGSVHRNLQIAPSNLDLDRVWLLLVRVARAIGIEVEKDSNSS